MNVVDRALGAGAFGILSLATLLAPWCFGAWETWWFWPFATSLLLAVGLCGLRLLLSGVARVNGATGADLPRAVRLLPLVWLPLLAYAAVRTMQAPVFFDAERSLLLLLLPVLIGALIIFGSTPAQRRLLFQATAVNLLLLGLYGIVNHLVTGSRWVLWEPGFPNYYEDGRATGSYFCPDHYAGILELGACIGLALLVRGRGFVWRPLGAALLVVGAVGVGMSKSRGGGMTLVVILVAAAIWGVAHLPRAVRPWLRLAVGSFMVVAVLVFALTAHAYTERFLHFFGGPTLKNKPLREAVDVAVDHVMRDARPQMFSGAWRAWKTHPWFGIGPGMHENVWPHFAASPDGDRATGRWPTMLNNHYNANAVHNDWLQLLQEYGAVGFVLFLLPAGWCWVLIRRPLAAETRVPPRHSRRDAAFAGQLSLAALLAIVAMAFHSLGDFNLQMPATNWLVAVLVALPLATPQSTLAPSPGDDA